MKCDGVFQGPDPRRSEFEVDFAPAALFGKGFAFDLSDIALVVHLSQEAVERAVGVVLSRIFADLSPDRHTVGLINQTPDGQEHHLFCFADLFHTFPRSIYLCFTNI